MRQASCGASGKDAPASRGRVVSAAAAIEWADDEAPEDVSHRQARWHRVAVAAVKQSLRQAQSLTLHVLSAGLRLPFTACRVAHYTMACHKHLSRHRPRCNASAATAPARTSKPAEPCRTHSLDIRPPMELGQLVAVIQEAPLSLVAAAGGQPLLEALPAAAAELAAAAQPAARPALLIVGPEGDFTGVSPRLSTL